MLEHKSKKSVKKTCKAVTLSLEMHLVSRRGMLSGGAAGTMPPFTMLQSKRDSRRTWNMGGTTWGALEEWVDTRSQEEDWDLLLLQETFRNVDSRHLCVPQGWDTLHTCAGRRAAPAIAINRRMTEYLADTAFGETYTAVFFKMFPPLIAISWHAPNAGQGEEEEQTLGS